MLILKPIRKDITEDRIYSTYVQQQKEQQQPIEIYT